MLAIVLVIALVIALGVAGFILVWAFNNQAADSERVIGMPSSPSVDTFVGGLRSNSGNASWPMARLEFFDWGIRVGASGLSARWLVPTWEARYEELATVRLVSVLWSSGVRFAVKGRTDAVVFWTGSSRQIGARLQEHGVPVDWSTVSLREAGGIYRTW